METRRTEEEEEGRGGEKEKEGSAGQAPNARTSFWILVNLLLHKAITSQVCVTEIECKLSSVPREPEPTAAC